MTKTIQAVRGMQDVLPAEMPYWHRLEAVIREVMAAHVYQEIRFPILEKTDLFKRTIGDLTDIVEKEMYTFEDRSGESLSLRPEGTACCVRAGIEHGLLYHTTARFWYYGPMFRHERPQRGRLRQFHQLGVEAFGFEAPVAEAEHLLLTKQILEKVGLLPLVKLEINSLGSAEERATYRRALTDYWQAHYEMLDEDSLRRLQGNPLRILDSKNPALQPLIAKAPQLLDFLGESSRAHFAALQQFLSESGLVFEINPRLVRGLDYYNATVYEWTTTALGAQGTVCAGGRFDGLVEQLGGEATPAVGFALGAERIIAMMQQQAVLTASSCDVYMVASTPELSFHALSLAERLRQQLPALRLSLDLKGGAFKNQLKRADKSGAAFALIVAPAEAAAEKISVKALRDASAPQHCFTFTELVDYLGGCFHAGL